MGDLKITDGDDTVEFQLDAALAREAALRSENERLELLVKDFQWGAPVEAQAGDEARTELAVLNEHIELLTADLAWSENDSRDQSKELDALREELAKANGALSIANKTLGQLADSAQAAEQRNADVERALSGLLFEFDDGVNGGRDEPVAALDYARTLVDGAEFKPVESEVCAKCLGSCRVLISTVCGFTHKTCDHCNKPTESGASE